MIKTHFYTESGSRYTLRQTEDGLVVEGCAEKTDLTRGMDPGEEYPVLQAWCELVVHELTVRLCVQYIPPDLDEGAEFRYKRSSPIRRIEEEEC